MKPKAYLDAVRSLSCIVCGAWEVHAHHARSGSMAAAGFNAGMAQKPSDYFAIPLCELHHTGADGIHWVGVEEWEERHGKQIDMVRQTGQTLGVNPFSLAEIVPERKHKVSSKIIPHAGKL